jgi:hypothetical protein
VKIIASCAVSAIALLAVTGVHAAEADKANVTRMYRDIVEPSHQQAYEAAVKNYNKCLGQHGVKYSWQAWGHETGNTYMYSYAAGPYAWSDFDTLRDTAKVCDETWRTEANPHLQGEISVFLIGMPELSRVPTDKNAKPALLNVTLFTVKPSREADDAFIDGMKKITAAAAKSKWSGRYMLYKTKGGDKGVADYIILSPYKNWAEYGAGSDPSVWTMLEGVYGKSDADALRKSINDALEDVSSHVDSYSADLTYIASRK